MSDVLDHLDRLIGADDLDAVAGFFEKSKYPDGTSIPQTMFFNEYGTVSENGKEHTKPRPFMRRASQSSHKKWAELLHDLLASGMDAKAAYSQVAAMMSGDIKKSINDFKAPGNEQATIDRKGFDAPLRDTKMALNSVSWDVVKRGKLKGIKE